jgi:hypothetical protein
MASLHSIIHAAFDLATQLDMTVNFTHAPHTGFDANGTPAFGTGTTVKGVWDARQRLVRLPDGREVVSRGTAIVPATPAISVQDRLTLPDGSTPVLLEVRPYQGASTRYFQEVIFG